MVSALVWYLLITAFGLAAAPLAFTWLRHMPDRGWGVSRPLGWMLAGYAVWLLAYFDMARVSGGVGFGALLLVALASWAVLDRWGGGWRAWKRWLRAHWRLVALEEGIFLAAFLLWTLVRAHDSAIAGTEKPMELAFLSSVMRGGTVPPADPWLAGYAISYYYFGYLLVGLLAHMAGVPSAVAFNLALALLFALTLLGAFSLGYNLTRTVASEVAARVGGLLSLLFVGVIGNLEGFFEVLNANGYGSAAFYRWLDIKNLVKAPPTGTWYPTEFWWWWRASRVIRDRMPLTGADQEVITEFPFFSFLLGDLHPHVLALPFVLLALTVAFNVWRSAWKVGAAEPAAWSGGWLPFDGWVLGRAWGIVVLLLSVWVVGGLGFLNAWDFPTYGLVLMAAWFLGAALVGRVRGWPLAKWAWQVLPSLVLVPLGGLLLYLPFYIGLQTQAKGVGLVIGIATKLHQYLIIHGLFYWVWGALLAALVPVAWRRGVSRFHLFWTVGVLGGLAVGVLLRNQTLLFALLMLWGTGWALWAYLDVAVGVQRQVQQAPQPAIVGGSGGAATALPDATSLMFALLMGGVAIALTVGTELVFVRDVFGTRMNTVFKFYYQAWMLLAVASAFGVVWLVHRLPLGPRLVWGAGLGVLLAASLLYPVAATWSKTNRFAGPATLDGLAWFRQARPADAAVVAWLNANVVGQPTILEATGPQYSEYARISTTTGLPTLLGWGGHELQWRGTYDEPGRREPIIARIYQTTDPEEAQQLMEEFGVRYVVVGDLERQAYQLSQEQVEKFRAFMKPVLELEGIVLFAR